MVLMELTIRILRPRVGEIPNFLWPLKPCICISTLTTEVLSGVKQNSHRGWGWWHSLVRLSRVSATYFSDQVGSFIFLFEWLLLPPLTLLSKGFDRVLDVYELLCLVHELFEGKGGVLWASFSMN